MTIGCVVLVCAIAGCVYLLVTSEEAEDEAMEERTKHLPIKERIEAQRAERLRRARRPANPVEPARAALYRVELVRLDIVREARDERLQSQTRAVDLDERE